MTSLKVQLRAAKIPLLGWLAHHYWYVVIDAAASQRWEVWQWPNVGGKSWGHLHCDLLPPAAGVGNGASWLVEQWHGPTAEHLALTITSSPQTYPHTHRYCYWPGPNCNTYVQWVLDQAKIDYDLDWQGIGRDYQNSVFSWWC